LTALEFYKPDSQKVSWNKKKKERQRDDWFIYIKKKKKSGDKRICKHVMVSCVSWWRQDTIS
jgi:hypothetical protein